MLSLILPSITAIRLSNVVNVSQIISRKGMHKPSSASANHEIEVVARMSRQKFVILVTGVAVFLIFQSDLFHQSSQYQ